MRAVVFDLDGTLIDSDPDIRAALNRVLAEEGLAPLTTAEVQSMIGDGAKALVERGFAARGHAAHEDHVAAFIADYEANAVVETVPYPGIVEALQVLSEAGHPLGVCTNKPVVAARNVLAALGLDKYFRAIVGGDSTAYRKPNPKHLAAVLQALGAAPERAVMVGDHANDIAAAAGLGVPSIFVSWGYGKAQGSHTIDKALDLPGLVAQMG
ncbi:phosphoglycolate phosphatase [Acidocella sp.]|jgi:phosphoglycolate phosphatase|uniref:phosphoglycolate phosphatase n=1 Tax=Acidocella sp. TaxID=50710 RepID=UPI002F419AD3